MPDIKILFLILAITIAFVFMDALKKRFSSNTYTIKDYDKRSIKLYHLQPSILTKPELILYRVIIKHMQGRFIIAPKVRLADFIKIKGGQKSGPTSTTSAFNRISGKHCDFMICNLNGKPLAWLELDDATHLKASAKKADKFKNEVASIIGIPLYRIKTGTDYNAQITHISDRLS